MSDIPDYLAPYTNSVFQVSAVSKAYDYSHPWDPPGFGKTWRGSSFALEYKGRKVVVTNAHVSGDSSQLSVRFSNDCKPYHAKVLSISHVCDLALLDIEDPEFWEKAVCLELGEMPDVQDEVKVVGFPQGGNEICVTAGRVNRIEIERYEQGGVELLNYQFDAALTNGNSGGPVFFKDKIMGVAFQGLNDCDTTNYGIPVVVLEHFLEDTFYHNNGGFPDLNIKWQNMTNVNLRESFGMEKYDSGVLVTKIDPLSDASPYLKVNDIILAIDDKTISNDGKVDLGIPLRNRIDFSYIVNMKYISDIVTLRVLRDSRAFDVDVVLTKCHRGTKKVGLREYDKPGEYFINSYLAFVPMTENYLEDVMGELGALMKSDKAKDEHGDQHIVLSHVFPHQDTYSYEKFDNSFVKKVNDIEIRNMKQLIDHLDYWDGFYVKVELKEGEIIVVPKLSYYENMKFLKTFQIRHDRSANFREKDSDSDTSGESSGETLKETMTLDPNRLRNILMKQLFGGAVNFENDESSGDEEDEDSETYETDDDEDIPVVDMKKNHLKNRHFFPKRDRPDVDEFSEDFSRKRLPSC